MAVDAQKVADHLGVGKLSVGVGQECIDDGVNHILHSSHLRFWQTGLIHKQLTLFQRHRYWRVGYWGTERHPKAGSKTAQLEILEDAYCTHTGLEYHSGHHCVFQIQT